MTEQQRIALQIPAYTCRDFEQPTLHSYLTGAKQVELCAWLSFYFYPKQAAAIAQLDATAADYEARARKILFGASSAGNSHTHDEDTKAEGEVLFARAQKAEGEAAKDLFTRAVLHGHVEAMGRLAWMYQNGKFGTVNLQEAMRWYLAAAQENGAAYGELGDILFHSNADVTSDKKQAMLFYEYGAKKGDAYCCLQMGEAYMKGLYVERSNEQARYWYQQVILCGESRYKAEAEAKLSCL